MTPRTTLAVRATCRSSRLTHSQFIAQKTKDAIVDVLRDRAGARPSVDRDDPDVGVAVHLVRDRATVYLDVGGASLHERGWRARGGAAPLRENLAAAVVRLSGWDRRAAAARPDVRRRHARHRGGRVGAAHRARGSRASASASSDGRATTRPRRRRMRDLRQQARDARLPATDAPRSARATSTSARSSARARTRATPGSTLVVERRDVARPRAARAGRHRGHQPAVRRATRGGSRPLRRASRASLRALHGHTVAILAGAPGDRAARWAASPTAGGCSSTARSNAACSCTRSRDQNAAMTGTPMNDDARAVVAALGLAPHPEGGYYRETFRAPLAVDAPQGRRAASTAIYFLLPAGTLLGAAPRPVGRGVAPLRRRSRRAPHASRRRRDPRSSASAATSRAATDPRSSSPRASGKRRSRWANASLSAAARSRRGSTSPTSSCPFARGAARTVPGRSRARRTAHARVRPAQPSGSNSGIVSSRIPRMRFSIIFLVFECVRIQKRSSTMALQDLVGHDLGRDAARDGRANGALDHALLIGRRPRARRAAATPGRLRSDSEIFVLTQAGQSTLTFTLPRRLTVRSWCRHSLSATTPCLVTQYGAIPGTVTSPAIDAVLTTCPSPCSTHARHERAHAVDDAPEVHADRPLPVRQRGLPRRRPARADAGVVADDVRRAERLERALRELLDLLPAGDVGLHGDRLDAAAADLFARLGERTPPRRRRARSSSPRGRIARPSRDRCRWPRPSRPPPSPSDLASRPPGVV